MKSFILDIDVTYETMDGLEFEQRIYLEVVKTDNFFQKRTELLERFEKAQGGVDIVGYEVANQGDYNNWLAR